MKSYRVVSLFLIVVLFVALSSGCNSNSGKSDPENSAKVQGAKDKEEIKDEVGSEDTKVDKEVEWVEFRNEEKNFTLMHPSNWIIVDRESYGVVLRPKEETQTSFYVDTESSIYADRTYDDFIDEMMGNLLRIRKDCTFSESESIQINGYPFVVLNYNGPSPDGTIYYYRTFFTANTLGYTMYYVASEAENVLYQEIMEKIAMSFKFLK